MLSHEGGHSIRDAAVKCDVFVNYWKSEINPLGELNNRREANEERLFENVLMTSRNR